MQQFENLLKTLSQICQVYFAINDRNGLLFSTQPEQHDSQFVEAIRQFSANILDEDTFKYESRGQYDFYGIPVKTGDEPTAALVAYKDRSLTPANVSSTAKMESVLLGVAELIGNWSFAQKESDELAEQLTLGFEAISLYSRITPQITGLGFSESMLNNLIEDLLETMRVDLVFTSILDREGYSLLVRGKEAPPIAADLNMFVESLINAIPADNPTLKDNYYIINDSTTVPDYKRLHSETFRFLVTAIEHQNKSYGWLGMVSFNMKEIFRFSELRMLATVAKQSAIALSNIDLYVELEQFVINVVRSLVYTIEAKDTYTRGHSERVSQYSMAMAEKLHLNKEERRSLFWASILHDMGKIGISEIVLNKPGRLDTDEYQQIKMHSEKGYQILKPLKQLVKSLEGILHHHECFDGSGYPGGLKGHEIPLQSRIIAVADTFDAITSNRSYRPQREAKEALAIINEVAGSQLDPELVRVFEAVFNDKAILKTDGDLFEEQKGADDE